MLTLSTYSVYNQTVESPIDANAAPSTRDALIDAAAALIDAGGSAAVNLREVGRLVGVTRTTPYRHFENKEALLAAVAERFYSELESLLRSAVSRPRGARPRLRAAFGAYADYVITHPERYRLMLGNGFRLRDHAGAFSAAGRAFDVLKRAVAEVAPGNPSGPSHDERLALICYASCHGVLDLTLSGHLPPEKGLTPQAALDTILGALCDTHRDVAGGAPTKTRRRFK